jgi:hypothetical protein
LKMVMDEIFSNDNFRNEIIWSYRTGGVSKKTFARKHDTILFYTKSNRYNFNTQYYQSWQMKKYNYSKKYPDYFDQKTKKWYHLAVCRDVWDDTYPIGTSAKERLGYPTQKPEALLERIIKVSSNEGDIVLDPFCGCGTTVIVASKLNRQFIGIDIDTSARAKGELPTAFIVIKNRSHELFAQSRYVSRDLSEVLEMNPKQFEDWVNEFYKANKPSPDKGVDGITPEGVPIQVKTFEVGYKEISQLVTDAKYHPQTVKPIKKVMVVSQIGFDDRARQRKFEIETQEKIEVYLTTPEEMLKLEHTELSTIP